MNFDAIIVGGGPAGAAAGIQLAKNGWKTAVLEKSVFPRHKVCGEFFSPGSLSLWKELGVLEKIMKENPAKITSASLFFPGQKEMPCDLQHPGGHAYGLSRFTFDRILLRHAEESGCRIFHETEAMKIEENETSCFVTAAGQKLTSSFVIMAAGRSHRFAENSKTSRSVKVGFKRHFEVPNPPTGLELYFFPGGYLGLIQIENGRLNLCGILERKTFKEHGNNFDRLIAGILPRHPALAARLKNSKPSTPWLSCVTTKGFKARNTRRVLWAGDSAYFLEPMIGQGMTMAVACGILAAKALSGHENPGFFFDAQCKKLLKSKTSLLNFLEPLGGICSKAPRFSRIVSRMVLKPRVIEKILSVPA